MGRPSNQHAPPHAPEEGKVVDGVEVQREHWELLSVEEDGISHDRA